MALSSCTRLYLKRKKECGNPCKACNQVCPTGAIENTGNINMKAVGSINFAAGGRITEAATTRQSNILGLNDNKAGVFDMSADPEDT